MTSCFPRNWATWYLRAQHTAFHLHCNHSRSSTFLHACWIVAFAYVFFARRYLRAAKSETVDHVRFASKLWGDSYFNASSRTFQQRPPSSDAPRSFVEFILEPMYKIITCVLGEAAADVKHTLAQVKANSTAANCWTIVDDNVYNLTTWINAHPGGANAIMSLCGVDGTSAFKSQHAGRAMPAGQLESLKIGTLK